MSDELQHAIVILVLALANYVTWHMGRRQARREASEKPLAGHPPETDEHLG